MSTTSDRLLAALTRRPLLLLVLLYGAIIALAMAAWRWLPEPLHRAMQALTGGEGLGVVDGTISGRVSRLPEGLVRWALASVAMVSAGLLTTPLAWLYTITRSKRGFQQSVVHTLVLLPVIVAGVAVLVKYSLALAFSLAGIVAAVRFRNTLEDSKDAVYIFVATAIGLASGVELTVALTLSIVFNLTTLLLFRTDFGRTPARLEGEMAEARMQRALRMANRTSQFVARVDKEILENMAPEQLEALADRAWKRRKDAMPEGDEDGERYDTALVLKTDGSAQSREAVEAVLREDAKRWRVRRLEEAAQPGELAYELRLRKSVTPTAFLGNVRRAPGVLEADLK